MVGWLGAAAREALGADEGIGERRGTVRGRSRTNEVHWDGGKRDVGANERGERSYVTGLDEGTIGTTSFFQNFFRVRVIHTNSFSTLFMGYNSKCMPAQAHTHTHPH